MSTLVEHFRKIHSADVFLLTPTTINVDMWEGTIAAMGLPAGQMVKSNRLHRQYADVVLEVAQQASIPAIDLYKLFEDASASGLRDDQLYTDGVHYTAKGYEVNPFWTKSRHIPSLTLGTSSSSFCFS